MNALFAAPTNALVSPDCVRETIQKILRAAQVRFTDEQLAELSGVDARAIKSYRVEGREPSLSRALSLLCVLGGGDLNRILNLVGYSARPHDECDALPAGEVVACILTHTSTIAKAAADGHFDINDRRALKLVGQRQVERGMMLVAMGA